ncbi:MAG TPA: hypothetical protein VNL91_06700 [Thermoanaerobaculia bacterium]|nr:hypothetical protein [Thermoanaerobaculia bacterium]
MVKRLLCLSSVLFVAAVTLADGQHRHDHGPVDLGTVGKVRFRTTCDRAVRTEFSRAVALMHSFWYAEAEKAFTRIAAKDPDCAMAWWGVAMSNYHPLWAPPTPEELRRGREASERAMAMRPGSDRERAWIEAIHTFYAESDRLDHRTRAAAYEKAMEGVAAKNPDDREASIFHALAILGTASPNDKTYASQKKAAAILDRMLEKEPEHPGIAHYVIHSYDYPQLASMALPAARRYAKLAPGSPHALHMPSHIFTRLGLWDESIASNRASAEKARHYIRQIRPDGNSFDELHAIDYLVYAFLQQAKDDEARLLVEKLMAVDPATLDAGNFAAAYAFSAVPARWAIERRRWEEAARLNVVPANFPWKNLPYAEANVHFARALGAARSGDLNTARNAFDRLSSLEQILVEQKNAFWAEQVKIQRLAAHAWLARAIGLKEEALRLARAAADLEDATEKHPVTPGSIVPSRELLAEMLLEDGKAAEALAEAEKSLQTAPRRYNGIWLTARAAERSGDRARAEAAYRSLIELAGGGTREELTAARNFVAAR